MMEQGYLAIILHAHLPFVKHPARDHALEENWLKEAMVESYLPLLMMLEDLINDGIDFRITLSLTPTLASMLLDPVLTDRFLESLDRAIALGQKEVARTRSRPPFQTLAVFYRDKLENLRQVYVHRYRKNLIHILREMESSGNVEILAGAATHGYLPLLSQDPGAVRTQIHLGIDTYKRLFGHAPQGFWLPECGYMPGVDDILKEYGIRYTILETHGITRAEKRPVHGIYAPIQCPSHLAVFGRDPEASRQVWSSVHGYPADGDYREFYRDIAYDLPLDEIRPFIHPEGIRIDTGYKYFRVTGQEKKEIYDLERARQKADIHAEDFISAREKKARSLSFNMDRPPVFVAPYDAELFGHWWYEGPTWLNRLFRKMDAGQRAVRSITLSEYLDRFPDNQYTTPSASSWGARGYHQTWINEKNDWIYPHLHKGAFTMQRLASGHRKIKGIQKRALAQAGRELLLAQASDWAFMMHTGDMAEYGRRRTTDHVDRLNRLAWGIDNDAIDERWLGDMETQDTIFPHIDYRLFCDTTTI